MKIRSALCALAIAATAWPASAQQQPPPAGGAANAASADWYRDQLSQLAEILGGAHYLRILCEGRGDQRWRDYMRGVMQREPNYNSVLVEGFNRGYRDEEARFPTCDETTRQMEAELRARGLRVSRALSARHGETPPSGH
jgi:uncharacterized protein (TIGR02301 family)